MLDVSGDLTSDKIEIQVQVTNTGSCAGKEVVQVYATPPYTKGGIEKAAVDLVGFAKTSELQPGSMETVTITVVLLLASVIARVGQNRNPPIL